MNHAVAPQAMNSLVIRSNNRISTLMLTALGLGGILLVALGSVLIGDRGITMDFSARMLAPSWQHWFGTDQFGHDMLARTLHGLSLSLNVGLITAALSTAIAVVLAMLAATGGRWADAVVSFLIDTTLGLPHLMLLILIAFALGGGTTAVIIAVTLTHWPRLTRILRAEILQVRSAEYVQASRQFGKSWWYIGRHHLLPHLLPQTLVGFTLLFPHAILHEAALTFLGFGLEPGKPAIGTLLADSMRYLMAGNWWLGLFPGLGLLLLVLSFDAIGNGIRKLTDPRLSEV
ncbi:ABC transporter permease [Marinobacterium mangrovicola]|uniref:Peptide/nickel transport system permease protein n=1 Tax=Marinobacterium mangrovicola TaxID=1476959 RepID=A0A4R1GSH1_9GAMM|nr:ABC transporter permease [Marinobacterium mangrovicola]TCK09169.1 peptide/nickel transport system permease protein [Marinobacterium mangrovicola]